MKPPRKRRHRAAAFSLLLFFVVLIPAGYWVRFRAPWPAATRDAGGGAIYVLLWITLAGACFPRASPARLSSAVTGTTCVLEILQLWHPPLLEAIRSTFAGRVLLGTTFSWSDFPPYFAGGAAGWLLLWLVPRHDDRTRHSRQSR